MMTNEMKNKIQLIVNIWGKENLLKIQVEDNEIYLQRKIKISFHQVPCSRNRWLRSCKKIDIIKTCADIYKKTLNHIEIYWICYKND